MSDHYYVRVRGEVKGPVPRDQLVAQIRKKRMGRHHEVSTDAVNWMRAGDVPELFEPTVSIRHPEEAPQQSVEEPELSRSGASEDAADAEDVDWMYAKGRNRLGPVSEPELRTMLATGRITGGDLVWNNTLEDWIPAGSLPQFAGLCSVPNTGGETRSQWEPDQNTVVRRGTWVEALLGTSKGAALPEQAAQKFPNLTRYLGIAEGVARILFVVVLVLLGVGWITGIAQTIRNRDSMQLILTLIAGPAVVLLYWLLFISLLACLEIIKVCIRIEHNTSRG